MSTHQTIGVVLYAVSMILLALAEASKQMDTEPRRSVESRRVVASLKKWK